MPIYKYIECSERDIPEGVRFDVPDRHKGQMIEVAYGGFGRYSHDDGDAYKRVTDFSIGPVAVYYHLEDIKKQKQIFTLEPGREIYKDGKPFISICREAMTVMPTKIDDITKRIIELLNKYGE